MGKWKVYIHRRVAKKARRDVVEACVDTVSENPFSGKKICRKTYRVRIGEYRCIYVVEKKSKAIYILRVGKRESVYEGFECE